MSEPFLSEIKIVSFNFPPKGWAFCNGQILPINQNQALFSLMGTTYGGDGRQTFGLPNLQGRLAMHMGNGHTLGEQGGSQAVTLTSGQMPPHHHNVQCNSGAGNLANPTGYSAADDAGAALYASAADGSVMAPGAVSSVGGGQPHENMAPYLVLNFCIALQGIFPSQN